MYFFSVFFCPSIDMRFPYARPREFTLLAKFNILTLPAVTWRPWGRTSSSIKLLTRWLHHLVLNYLTFWLHHHYKIPILASTLGAAVGDSSSSFVAASWLTSLPPLQLWVRESTQSLPGGGAGEVKDGRREWKPNTGWALKPRESSWKLTPLCANVYGPLGLWINATVFLNISKWCYHAFMAIRHYFN